MPYLKYRIYWKEFPVNGTKQRVVSVNYKIEKKSLKQNRKKDNIIKKKEDSLREH